MGEPLSVQRQPAAGTIIEEFFRLEAAGGVLLVIASIVALVWANTPWRALYTGLLSVPVGVHLGSLALDKPLLLWINDALMAIFFLLVGMEIKREVLQGELSSVQQAALPCVAAVGGMLGPALVYSVINWGDPVTMHGWAIPAATDIAFSLGVLALLGARAPSSLKIFLLALAIIDDLGAIVIIALFYTEDLSLLSLGLAAAGLVALLVLNLAGVRRIAPYALVGIFLWVCVLKSGVHATLAGVALGFAVPLRGAKDERRVAAAPSRAHPASLGHLRHPADIRLRQRGRIAQRLVAEQPSRAGHTRQCARAVPRQADRRHGDHLDRGPARHRQRSERRLMASVLRSGAAHGHWIYDEPVHRHARVPGPGVE